VLSADEISQVDFPVRFNGKFLKNQNQSKMTDVYQVVSIEGKGRGIVATKFIKRGTLILKEGVFSRLFVGLKKFKKKSSNLIWYG
jgi:hypothetical protein